MLLEIIIIIIVVSGIFMTSIINYIKTKKKINYFENKTQIPIYYINMKKSIERNDNIKCQFIKDKLTRVEAITPNDISYLIENFKTICIRNVELEFACLMSHLKCIHLMYHSDNEVSLILEDDIIIKRNIDYNTLFQTVPLDWEILQMHVLNSNIITKKVLWSKWEDYNFSCAAYIINKKGAKKILEAFFPSTFNLNWENQILNFNVFQKINCVSDYMIYNIANTYSCNDYTFSTHTNESTLHSSHLFYQALQNLMIQKHFEKLK